MSLSKQEIQHIAKLARLGLSDQEIEEYQGQLDSILEYVSQLQKLKTRDVPELQHAAGLVNTVREDVIERCDPDVRKRAIELFTNKEGDLLEVQAVFDSSSDI